MSRVFALIGADGKVENVIAVDDSWTDGVDVTNVVPRPSIGWSYADGVFTDETPAAPPTPVAPRIITNLAFNSRFTNTELVQLKIVAAINPAATTTEQQLSATVAVYNDKMAMAKYINLDDPRVLDGLEQLEYLGVLATGRANEIVSAPVQDAERP